VQTELIDSSGLVAKVRAVDTLTVQGQAGATALTADVAQSTTTQCYVCYIRGHGPKAWTAHSELLRGARWRRIVFSPLVTESGRSPVHASAHAARQSRSRLRGTPIRVRGRSLTAQIASNNRELLESR
jgi:hypothetical protein